MMTGVILDNKHVLHLDMFLKVTDRKMDNKREKYIDEDVNKKGNESFLL